MCTMDYSVTGTKKSKAYCAGTRPGVYESFTFNMRYQEMSESLRSRVTLLLKNERGSWLVSITTYVEERFQRRRIILFRRLL